MMSTRSPVTVLMAEDDPDDRAIAQRAWRKSKAIGELRFVHDGVELLDYLLRRGEFGSTDLAPRPGLLLVDLNMPRMDGREAIREIRNHSELRRIPIVVFTTSTEETDIVASYDLGVNSYVAKPDSFGKFVEILEAIGEYWVEIVELPPN